MAVFIAIQQLNVRLRIFLLNGGPMNRKKPRWTGYGAGYPHAGISKKLSSKEKGR